MFKSDNSDVETICSICQGQKGKYQCQQCSSRYCSTCYKTDHSKADCPKHKIVRIEQNSSIISFCTRHPEENEKLWCENCSKIVCSTCSNEEHQQHSCQQIEIEAKKKAEQQKILSKKIQKIFENFLEKTFDFDENENLDKITKIFNSFRSMIDAHENELKEKILQIQRENKENFENFQNQLKKKHEEFVQRQKSFDNFLEKNDHLKLLEIHRKTIDSWKKTARYLAKLHFPKPQKFTIKQIVECEENFAETLREIFVIQDEQSENSHFDHLQAKEKLKINHEITPTISSSSLELNDEVIPSNINWNHRRIVVAGGNHQGSRVHQLSGPSGLFVDEDKTIYITDFNNHRVVQWKMGAKRGIIVAGGNGKGPGLHQLNRPYDVVLDKKTKSLIISDNGNFRVVRWFFGNRIISGHAIIEKINCAGLAMDDDGFLYVADQGKHEVRRYEIGDDRGTLVAGGRGKGSRLDQLCEPWYIHLDKDGSLYISDWGNHRVVKWEKGAKQGILVAGGNGKGNSLEHLPSPEGVLVDQNQTVFVSDSWNDRIMCWPKGSTKGTVIIGRHRVSCPIGLSFDNENNLYVVDWGNHRIQRFSTE